MFGKITCNIKNRWEPDCKNVMNIILLRFRLLKIAVIKTSHFIFTIYLNNSIWSISQKKKTSWVCLRVIVDAKVVLNLLCLREPAHFVASMLPILMRYKVSPLKIGKFAPLGLFFVWLFVCLFVLNRTISKHRNVWDIQCTNQLRKMGMSTLPDMYLPLNLNRTKPGLWNS